MSYGLSAGSVIRAEDLVPMEDGSRFRIREGGVDRGHFRLRVPGVHNVRNALAVAAAAREVEVGWEAVREGLGRFEGVGRRLQLVGEVNGIRLVDDYAHHPTELRAALEAVREAHPGRRLVAVFQPHLYSRTRDFAEAFGEALTLADRVWITEVYPAREEPIGGVDGELVARMAREAGARTVRLHRDLETLPEALAGELEEGDVCLTMGAGSIGEVAPALLQRLASPGEGGDA